MEKEFVYEFLYNPSTSESVAKTMSIHRTKKGAEMAMEFHKNEKYSGWLQECEEYPPAKEYPFDFNQRWRVVETELKD
jgi:hypothetical protein